MITKTIAEINAMINGDLYLNDIDSNKQVKGISIDSRNVTPGNIYLAIRGAKADGNDYSANALAAGAALIISDNADKMIDGVAYIIVEDSIKALQELATAYRKCLRGKVIGITGSNGKTSCKDILAAALSATYKTQKTMGNHNNELGVPLTILSFDEDSECLIVEMGMEQQGDIHFLKAMSAPDIGIVTNVGTAHLLTFKTMDNIGRGKLEMMDVLADNQLFIYKGDDAILSRMILEKDQRRLEVKTFGNKATNDLYLKDFKQSGDGICFKTNESDYEFKLKILGRHQADNALAAILVAHHLGLNNNQIQAGFDTLENTGMRNELIRINKCLILDDSYKSNPQSAKAALATFEGFKAPYKLVVMGDMLDLGPDTQQIHYQLGKDALDYTFDEFLGYGELSKKMIEGVEDNSNRKCVYFETHEALFNYLKPYLNTDCMILFKGSRGMALDKVIALLKGEQ